MSAALFMGFGRRDSNSQDNEDGPMTIAQRNEEIADLNDVKEDLQDKLEEKKDLLMEQELNNDEAPSSNEE
jgi:vacuolar-type H+-ATPase subunit I/STV1